MVDVIDLTDRITIVQGVSNTYVYIYNDKYYIYIDDDYYIATQYDIINNEMHFVGDGIGYLIRNNPPTFVNEKPPCLE